MHTDPLQLAAVIPVYNEEACIAEVIGAWGACFEAHTGAGAFRVIAVNDGSRDRSPAILDELAARYPWLLVVHQPNGGHGNAVRNGYLAAVALQPAFVFQTDSDNQFLPADFEKLWALRHQSPFILGHRLQRHDSRSRLFISSIVQLTNRVLSGVSVPDSNIPYRLMQTDYLQGLLQLLPENVFAPNIFLSVMAAAQGQDLKNIPVTHRQRDTGAQSIVKWGLLKACFRSACELWKYRPARRAKGL